MKKAKTTSLKDKIYRYNLVLIAVLIIVCSTYVLINARTIEKFNSTYDAYNELNGFYQNAKKGNDYFQTFLYSPTDENNKNYNDSIERASTNLEQVKHNLKNKDNVWRFDLLENMLIAFRRQADAVYVANLQQDKVFNSAYQKLQYEYSLIAQTSAEYYEIVTRDMQFQKKAIKSNQITMELVSTFFILYVILWLIYFSLTTIKSITNPVNKIVNNINRIKKGEYDLKEISNTNHEMNVLCLALEDMAEGVQKNLEFEKERAELEKRVLEQKNESLVKDELLVQSELRVLQNQINPHFLFNTLNMIYKKAYSEGAFETSELMEKTSQLLRYGLDNANKMSNLKNEITAIENYNYIQEKRYGDRIRFILEVDADITNIYMPSMILQPLVENAVSHGLKDTIEGGEVVIEITKQDQDIVISVSDNGVGMGPDQLERLLLNEFRSDLDDRTHLGMYNVTKRMKAFFGDHVNIFVNSMENCGFEIILRIQEESQMVYNIEY